MFKKTLLKLTQNVVNPTKNVVGVTKNETFGHNPPEIVHTQ